MIRAMEFPQYLWRIGTRDGWVLLRRGNTPDEPIEKSLRKDGDVWAMYRQKRCEPFPIGVSDHCGLEDKALYSSNHPWDWLNE